MKQVTAKAKARRPHPMGWMFLRRIQTPFVSHFRVKQGTVDGISTRQDHGKPVGNISQYEGGYAASPVRDVQAELAHLDELRAVYAGKADKVGLSLATYCNRFRVYGVLKKCETNTITLW